MSDMEARELIQRIANSIDLRHGGISPTLAIAVKAWTGANISTATIHAEGVTFVVYTQDDVDRITEGFGEHAVLRTEPKGLHIKTTVRLGPTA